MEDNPFDALAPQIDEYFKLYSLRLDLLPIEESRRIEIQDFVLAEIDKGKSALDGFNLLMQKDKSKLLRQLFKKLKKIDKQCG